MTRPFARLIGCLIASSFAFAPLALPAQVKLEVTPHFASYYTTTQLRRVTDRMFERQEAGPGLGGTLTWRFTNIWAVEAHFTYVKSGIVQQDSSSNLPPPTEAHLLMADARVVFQPRRTNIFFTAGAGTVSRGGPAFDVTGLDDKSDVAMLLGVGVRTRVTPNWAFKLGVEMRAFTTDINGVIPPPDPDYYPKRQQRDVLVTIGVPFALIGR